MTHDEIQWLLAMGGTYMLPFFFRKVKPTFVYKTSGYVRRYIQCFITARSASRSEFVGRQPDGLSNYGRQY